MLKPVNGSRVLYGHILDWFLVVGFLHNSFLLDFGMFYQPCMEVGYVKPKLVFLFVLKMFGLYLTMVLFFRAVLGLFASLKEKLWGPKVMKEPQQHNVLVLGMNNNYHERGMI